MSGNKGYVISFAVFFAVLLISLATMQIKSFEKRTFHAEVLDEIDSNNVYLAGKVIEASYEQMEHGEFLEWSDVVKKYCLLEGLTCGIGQGDPLSVKIQSKKSRMDLFLKKD